MTTPTTTKPAAKSTPAKATNAEVAVPSTNGNDRIPEILANSPIFKEFCTRYLEVVDEIKKYNDAVLAEKDSEWNPGKVLAKAREFANPEDASIEPDAKIKSAYDEWERLVTEVAKARRAVIDATAGKLGITLSNIAERDAEAEGPLKEKRKFATTIGKQLSDIAEMTSDKESTSAITDFLAKNALPAVGRNQASNFGSDSGGSTPKYRVTVKVFKDGELILEEKGFTKTGLALTQPKFGYERGKALKSDDLRGAWEKAGNSANETKQSTVEFEDNNLHFVITKN